MDVQPREPSLSPAPSPWPKSPTRRQLFPLEGFPPPNPQSSLKGIFGSRQWLGLIEVCGGEHCAAAAAKVSFVTHQGFVAGCRPPLPEQRHTQTHEDTRKI
jgi:hypothetical protein